ncbi:YaiI/YqxD family protein [Marinibactrum halimedae]|uniref:UPF0178 protein GCM10007877_28720 n=1 Tax=Marinibactrum halimedae TaxID=1444977 RepID=A0AA37WN57_9GAMM|nr:YaiI/YqxD family protein [Marinibactrum halimedae]MCD9458219.1 YaiI/YqxD family protein [Marinibactrum halimedae]GLS27153.1 UPF0178 protein [Marinibactrum halimedae]
MPIWIDADACPNAVKQILFRAAERTGVEMTFVANQTVSHPPFKSIRALRVEPGFDVADNFIAQSAEANDLVITSDIPLASEVIDKGAVVINFRGESLTKANIKARLNMRDFMDTLRSSGINSGGPPPFGQQEKQAFANQLDRWLAKHQ